MTEVYTFAVTIGGTLPLAIHEPPFVYQLPKDIESMDQLLALGMGAALLLTVSYAVGDDYIEAGFGVLAMVLMLGYYALWKSRRELPANSGVRALYADEIGRRLLKEGGDLMRQRNALERELRSDDVGQLRELERLLVDNYVRLSDLARRQSERLRELAPTSNPSSFVH